MIHPHIPRVKPSLTVRLDSSLVAVLSEEDQSYSFPIHGRAETVLSNALLHIASGLSAARIAEHFNLHNFADSHCPCCKLEGRIMAASGRRSVSGQAAYAPRGGSGGKVEIRHIRPGISGAQLKAYEAAYAKRTTPHSNVIKSVNKRIEDLI
jgi:hypothetical protein